MFQIRFSTDEIGYWAQRYVDGSTSRNWGLEQRIENLIVPLVRNKSYLDRDEFVTICEWKSPRPRRFYERNDEEVIQETTQIALSTSDERIKIGTLRGLRGVEWPVASAILHFCSSDPYPVLDFRALWSLGVERKSYNFEFWWSYVVYCRTMADQLGVTKRVLDRALWQYSNENQPRKARCKKIAIG